jgi:hypothetical protein
MSYRLRAIVSVSVALASLLAAPSAWQAPAPAALLAAARTSMGGDAALGAIRTVMASGTWTRDYGPIRIDSDVQLTFEAPDRFVRRDTRLVGAGGPVPPRRITTRLGVSGDRVIREEISDMPMPRLPSAPGTQTPADIAQRAARDLQSRRRLAAQLLLPFFATSLPIYPLTFEAAGRETAGDQTTDIVEGRSADGFVFRLHLDAASHRPVLLTWMDRPIVVVSSAAVVNVPAGGSGGRQVMPPPNLPSGDPTAGLADVEYRLTLTDYRTDGGVTWPRRLTLGAGGRTIEETRLSKVEVNRPVSGATFE